MTALNWELAPEHVIIMCDSLQLSGDDHRPLSMTTKVYPLPHLGLCIAGTGVQPVAERFWAHVNSRLICRNITHLNEFAPVILKEIWDDLLSECDGTSSALSGLTGTVYCYGWSVDKASFVGYVYRSTSNYTSESMSYGIAVKPAPSQGNRVWVWVVASNFFDIEFRYRTRRDTPFVLSMFSYFCPGFPNAIALCTQFWKNPQCEWASGPLESTDRAEERGSRAAPNGKSRDRWRSNSDVDDA